MEKLHGFRIVLCFVCVFTTSIISAHGSLSKRIRVKTAEISEHPKNEKLYFERGFLYEQHEEFNKAIKDYLKSEKLGNSNILIEYRKAKTYYYQGKFSKALESSNLYLEKNSTDVKIHKLHAQILILSEAYYKAIPYYSYFIKNTIDINPRDVIEYSEVFLSINNNNYSKAIEVIELGLNKLGKDVFSLQLKKLEYLEASLQFDKVIEQYNYFILSSSRKEFWYYKKAKYLFENNKINDTKIAIQQVKTAILLLNDKIINTTSIKNLKKQINLLELNLNQ